MKIGIGIDTGGTYTDAVVYDFDNRKVLGSAKALTTKIDLSIGILEAFDKLPAEYLPMAEVVSLSTTLATNACVEDKGGRAKLIFFGGDEQIIDSNGGQYGLPLSKEMHIQESYTTFSGEVEREPDWNLFINSLDNSYNQLDGVGIVEMNAMKTNAIVEKKAKELFRGKFNIPVVCGHELFSALNCLQRSSSTLLNAGLFPIIVNFLDAIKSALKQRGVQAEVVITRSDGSLMSEEFANLHPVETLLCGPAASVLGSSWLTDEKNSIIVDMGGTTTDIALVKDGYPVKVLDGVSVGKWKTFVDGIYIKTFGLGGDSAIHYYDNKLRLEEYRIVPLCVAAKKYPSVKDDLKKLVSEARQHTMFLYEFYMLVRDISDETQYTAEEIAFCKVLKDRPLICREAAAAVGKDIYNLRITRLLKEGIIQTIGLTPTDIMHIKGDFDRFDTEASLFGAEFVAGNLNITVDELCGLVYTEIKRKMYVNIVKVMLENDNPDYMKNGVNSDAERFINESFYKALTGRENGLMNISFTTSYALQGIGAPIHIFLEDIAEMLGTKAVIPEYHEVANALGAVVGNVHASCSVEIKPEWSDAGIQGYVVYGNDENKFFKELKDAEDFALSEAESGAREAAVLRGVKGEITVVSELNAHNAPSRDSLIYLGTTAYAFASGSMGF